MNICILGSTGSIGTQTIDIIKEHPELFAVSALTANRNWELLAAQALEMRPRYVAIADERFYPRLKEALAGTGIETAAGNEAMITAASLGENHTVVTAMVGYSGLRPTLAAIEAGHRIALANKETLVAGGELVMAKAREHKAEIIPVDSEHSAIFQCLQGENRNEMRKIILTASGGPFRKWPKEKLSEVSPADALKHPNWSMGAKVTIDSASMMNKGFEMIEARWLFDCEPSRIDVAVHPQSIVHSMVEFRDGSVKAQLGFPDMHLPIGYALGYPRRLESERKGLRLADYSTLTFEAPNTGRFPLLALAYEAAEKGGNSTCVLNAANEVAVEAFLKGRIGFTDMPVIASRTMERIPFVKQPTLEDITASDQEARSVAGEIADRLAIR